MMQLLHLFEGSGAENEIQVVSVSFSLFFGLIGDRSSFENHELNIQLRFVSLAVWNLCQHSLSFHFCSFVFF